MAKCSKCGLRCHDGVIGLHCAPLNGVCGGLIVADEPAPKFEVGDAVEHLEPKNVGLRDGTIGVVLYGPDAYGEYSVRFEGCSPFKYGGHRLKPVTFPIPADKDPWKTSERDHSDSESPCCKTSGSHRHIVCTRAERHAGHHVARDDEGVVYARWKNDSAEVVSVRETWHLPPEAGAPKHAIEIQRDASHSPSALAEAEAAKVGESIDSAKPEDWRGERIEQLEVDLASARVGRNRHQRRANELSDKCGALQTELNDAHRTIGELQRELRKLNRRPRA